MACRTGCPTGDHVNYADCCRNSGVRVAYCDSANNQDYTKQKRWDRELSDYRDARRQGIEPAGTDRASIDRAIRISDHTNSAYQA